MNSNLNFYRIEPGIIEVGKETEVTIRAIDNNRHFEEGVVYRVTIWPTTRYQHGFTKIEDRIKRVTAHNGKISFKFVYEKEEEYYINVHKGEEKDRIVQLSVYAVESDLYALRPLKGDTHCHCCPTDYTLWRKKDGADNSEVIPAEYRRRGYDFMTLTDHDRYFGSVEMQERFRKIRLGLCINRGEEVHAPRNFVHVVNFGGEYSVNEIFQNDPDRFNREVQEIVDTEKIDYFDKWLYATNAWVGRNIRKANGLAVFCHPHWISQVYNVPDELTRQFMKNKLFDAYEVVGASNWHCDNMKIALYNQLKDEGIEMPPLVGASDAHLQTCSPVFGKKFSIVFAEKNETKSLIKAIKEYRITPVEYLGDDYVVHGKYRYVSYARYLIEWYFPLTLEICEEEGNLMRKYVLGIEGAEEELNARADNTLEFYKRFSGRN